MLLSDEIFKEELKQHIQNIKNDNELSNDPQIKWKFLKYQIRKFTITFSKMRAKEERKQREELKAALKLLEKNLPTEENHCLYDKCKRDLEEIYDIAEKVCIRSRCHWYEEGEKSSKFFLYLVRFNGMQSQIRKIIVNDQEITDPNIILNEINFYKSLFRKGDEKCPSQIDDFIDKVQLPKSNITEINDCDNELSEKELCISLMSTKNNKSPGNDGLTKEIFVTFWEDTKDAFLNSCRTTKLKKELSTSQKQAVIKLIEKKDKGKRFIKNWRPVSLLNVDYKIISKALASKLKKALPNLISPQQTAYVENRLVKVVD